MLPSFLLDELKNEYGNNLTEKIVAGFKEKRPTTIRVNTIKANDEKIEKELTQNDIRFQKYFIPHSYIIENNKQKIEELDIYKNGEVYLQSLSSMLPPIILNPKSNTDILDMAAAPGGKTTQIAALTENEAHITACEMNTIRFERLKYNIDKQGATSVYSMQIDSRKINPYFSFDQILLDAPCSGSGTLDFEDKNIEKIFTEELVDKSVKTQIQLLEKALRILKPGKEMVYSTCSILKKENEEVLEKVLKKFNTEIIEIELDSNINLPLLPTTIKGTICICPNELYEGFFIAKIRKNY